MEDNTLSIQINIEPNALEMPKNITILKTRIDFVTTTKRYPKKVNNSYLLKPVAKSVLTKDDVQKMLKYFNECK